MEELSRTAQEIIFFLIEDAAEAIGSVTKANALAPLEILEFSLSRYKTMTTGEGGIFVTNDGSLYDTIVTK